MRIKTAGFELSEKKLPPEEISKIRESLYKYIDEIREYGDIQIDLEITRLIVRSLIYIMNALVAGYSIAVMLLMFGVISINGSILIVMGLGLMLIKFYLFKFDCVITRNIIASGLAVKSKMVNMGLNNPVVYESDVHLRYMYLILYRILDRYLVSVKLPLFTRIHKQFKDIIMVRYVVNLSDTCNLLSKSSNLRLQEGDRYEFWGLYRAFILEYEILRDVIWIYLSDNEQKKQYKNSLETKLLMMNPDLFIHLFRNSI